MMDLKKITRPTLLLDEKKCRKNIEMMASKARSSSVKFRPHFKTHQSVTIGEWFSEEGVESITVSSITMASHFADSGWKDITVAFPFNIRESEDLKRVSRKADINILASNNEHLSLICQSIISEAGCFFKINTGNNRSGTDWDNSEEIMRMATTISGSKKLRMKGFLTHAGHAYKSASKTEINETYNDTLKKLRLVRNLFPGQKLIISSGDTPSCSVIENFKGLDEIRPGNFVFYDLMQVFLGSCTSDQVAVAVACPVVEKNSRKREIIIYGGGVHLSKDSLRLNDGRTIFGQVVFLNSDGWIFPEETVYLRSVSQ
jgi:D-serine deaminase-like pyridoxal phosphate-dependent protein